MTQSGSNYWDQQLLSLGRVVHTLREGQELDGLIATTIEYLRESFEYRLIWLALFDGESHTLIGKGGWTPVGEIKFLRERFPLEAGDLLDTVVMQRKPLPIADLRKEARLGEWVKLAHRYEVQGTIVFPIYHRQITLGLTILGSHHWNVSPRAEEKARLSIVLGTLAASLSRVQLESQQNKRNNEPLLGCLDRVCKQDTLLSRLEEIVEEIQKLLLPKRTYIYWYDRTERQFTRRVANRLKTPGKRDQVNIITVQQSPGLYQTLISDQLLVMSDTKTTRSDLNLINLRIFNNPALGALIIVPILVKSELIGFISIENDQPRIWTEAEKRYLRGVVQLIALIAPLEMMEATIQQNATDQILTAGIVKAIYSKADWQESLEIAAEQLCQRLHVERFWLAALNRDTGKFEIRYQFHARNLRPLPIEWAELSSVDLQLLEQSREAVAVDNLESDLKFLSWRSGLITLGIKSLLLNSTSRRKIKLEAILIVGQEAPKSWSQADRELVQAVSQQLGLVLHQGELQRQSHEQQSLQELVHNGLVTMQACTELNNLHIVTAQVLAKVMSAPLAVLVTWSPGKTGGYITGAFSAQDAFKLHIAETMLAIDADPLVQWCLQTEEVLTLSVHDLPEITRQWLNAPGIGQIAALALRTNPDHHAMGIVLIVDRLARTWTTSYLKAFTLLTKQLSWSRRYLMTTTSLWERQQNLERLNWYKQARLEEVHRSVSQTTQRLIDKDANETNNQLRVQQAIKQLQASLAPLPVMIAREQWRLRSSPEAVSLAGLLKRSMERIDQQLHEKQLWSQVHNQTNVIISGDSLKIEMVIHELLLFACHRSEKGGRIDLWCRQVDDRSVELAITDYGIIDPQLLQELQEGRPTDLLAPSILDQPPGLHLCICQKLLEEAGGELAFYQLEDHRMLTRLVLPIAADNS